MIHLSINVDRKGNEMTLLWPAVEGSLATLRAFSANELNRKGQIENLNLLMKTSRFTPFGEQPLTT